MIPSSTGLLRVYLNQLHRWFNKIWQHRIEKSGHFLIKLHQSLELVLEVDSIRISFNDLVLQNDVQDFLSFRSDENIFKRHTLLFGSADNQMRIDHPHNLNIFRCIPPHEAIMIMIINWSNFFFSILNDIS